MTQTITEALAEIKVIDKRISSKQEFIKNYCYRMDGLKDPLEKTGGSEKAVKEEFQAIKDLEDRKLHLRKSIAAANDSHTIAIDTEVKPISSWLIWRREIAPNKQSYLDKLHRDLISTRDSAIRNGGMYVKAGEKTEKLTDYISNVDEVWLKEQREHLQKVFETLDGQLSLKNATVMVD